MEKLKAVFDALMKSKTIDHVDELLKDYGIDKK
jgi:hypothetical protein